MITENHQLTSLKLQYNYILISAYFFKNTILERKKFQVQDILHKSIKKSLNTLKIPSLWNIQDGDSAFSDTPQKRNQS